MEYINMFKNKRGMHYIMPFIFLVVIVNDSKSIVEYTALAFIIICVYEFYNGLDDVEIRMSAMDHLGYFVLKLFLESRLSLFILSVSIVFLDMLGANISDYKVYILLFLCIKIFINYKYKVPFEFYGIENTKKIIYDYKDIRTYEVLYQCLVNQENKAYMLDKKNKKQYYFKKIKSGKQVIIMYMLNIHSNIDMQLYRTISIKGDCYSMKLRRWVFQVYYTYLADKYILRLVNKYGWYEENANKNFKEAKLETYLNKAPFYVGTNGKQVEGISKVLELIGESQDVEEMSDDMKEVILKRLCYHKYNYNTNLKIEIEEKLRNIVN